MSATEQAVENLLNEDDWTGKIFSDGWVDAPETVEIVEPATGESLGVAGVANAASVAAATKSAAKAQRAWAATPLGERIAIVRRAGEILDRHRDEIVGWLVRETGSVPPKADVEVTASIGQFEMAASITEDQLEQVLESAVPGRASTARRQPLGVVGVITPWNFPLVLAMRSLGPAFVLGNAAVLKGDLNTPVTGCVLIARIFEEAGLPSGVLHVLCGGAEVGQALVEDPRVRMISFTGSTATGRLVGEAAGRTLKRAVLELGGNSPLIVLDDADIVAASSAGAWGSFLHQGQICLAVSRHLVHESIVEEYLVALTERAGHLPVGDPASGQVAIGPLINEKQIARVQRIVDETVAAGATAPRRRNPRRDVLPADGAARRDARDGGLQGGDLRPGRRSHDVQDRRGGDRARERHRVRAVGSRPVREPGARRRRCRPTRVGDGPHQRPDRQRGACRPVRGIQVLEQRRPLRRRRSDRALDRVAMGDVAGEGRAIPVLARRRRRNDGPCWDRTSDLGIKSPLLYQLS